MHRALLVCLSVAAVALAGCSESPRAAPDTPDDGLKPTASTGIIRGVAVDAAIKPLAGAQIVASSSGAEKTMTSAEDGTFGADGLAPGVWLLRASKLGYDPAQQTVEVVAGQSDPPIVKVLLVENPALRPYSETYVWRGFIECSAGVPEVGSVNPCFVLPTSSNVWEQNVTGVPAFVQAEMVWKPASVAGSSFWLSAFVDGEDLVEPDDYAEAMGGTPLILPIAGDLLDEKGVGADQTLAFRVFPGIDQPTVFLQQAFDVYITVFYGYAPPEDWTFVEDGPLLPA